MLQVIQHTDALDVSEEDIDEVWRVCEVKERLKFKMYGKDVTMRRRQAMFGDDYRFSGTTIPKEDKTPLLVQKALTFMNKFYGTPECTYNACLATLYEAGDYIGEHRDNEKKHRSGAPVASFSFGETRSLVIKKYRAKRKDDSFIHYKIPMPPNSATVMVGTGFQTILTHQVKKGHGERLSLTVRAF